MRPAGLDGTGRVRRVDSGSRPLYRRDRGFVQTRASGYGRLGAGEFCEGEVRQRCGAGDLFLFPWRPTETVSTTLHF